MQNNTLRTYFSFPGNEIENAFYICLGTCAFASQRCSDSDVSGREEEFARRPATHPSEFFISKTALGAQDVCGRGIPAFDLFNEGEIRTQH